MALLVKADVTALMLLYGRLTNVHLLLICCWHYVHLVEHRYAASGLHPQSLLNRLLTKQQAALLGGA
jgi:hypothetical protein